MRSWDWQEIVTRLLIPILYAILTFVLADSAVTRLLAVFLFFFFSYKIGECLTPGHPVRRWFVGALALGSLTVLLQVCAYYLNIRLGTMTDATSLVLSIWGLSLLTHFWQETFSEQNPEPIDASSYIWAGLVLIPASLIALYILKIAVQHVTSTSIRTPWMFFSSEAFIGFALLAVAAWMIAKRTSFPALTAPFAALSALSVTLIAPLLYKLGFGFDGFLHLASQRVLLQTGTLQPKPLYYIGQYALTTWLSRILELDIANLSRFLVPVGILGVIVALVLALETDRKSAFAVAGVIALLTLSPFVATTPQAFAYILGLMALILAFSAGKTIHPIVPLLLAAWSIATHPLAGLPFFGAVFAVLYAGRLMRLERNEKSSVFVYLLALVTSVSVPAAFFLFGSSGSQNISWNFSNMLSTFPRALLGPLMSIPANHVALWADWSSFVAYLLPIALWVLALLALRDEHFGRLVFPLLLIGAGTLLAGLFLKTVGDFAFLISYERSNYSDRLILTSQLLLLFPALIGFGRISNNVSRKSPAVIVGCLLMLGAWQAGHAYNALPRHDAAAASRGWSVGALDFEAVRFIEKDAAGQTYAVLANQSVSAAAVDTYGFRRYIHDEKTNEDIFYYPIPTGGALYQLYLKAVAPEPSFDAIKEAGELTKSETVYVVLNNYWWDAERVGSALEERADEVKSFGDDQVRVFRFTVAEQK